MSVIVELEVAAESFELGRALAVPDRSAIKLKEMVPLGDQVVPLFWLHTANPEDFIAQVESNEGVREVSVFEERQDRTLYALKWSAEADRLLGLITEKGGYLLSATGEGTDWTLQIRFPDYDSLSAFAERCDQRNISVDIELLYNPTRPEAGPWYGLTERQFETLELAIERGYYDIPRQISTQDLAEEFGISDQAVTERLRRAIRTLVDNTLRASDIKGSGRHSG